MCCCWPVDDVYVEENRAEHRLREFVWDGSRWVEITGRRCTVSIVFTLSLDRDFSGSLYAYPTELKHTFKFFWSVIPSNGNRVGLGKIGKTGQQTVRDTIPPGDWGDKYLEDTFLSQVTPPQSTIFPISSSFVGVG